MRHSRTEGAKRRLTGGPAGQSLFGVAASVTATVTPTGSSAPRRSFKQRRVPFAPRSCRLRTYSSHPLRQSGPGERSRGGRLPCRTSRRPSAPAGVASREDQGNGNFEMAPIASGTFCWVPAWRLHTLLASFSNGGPDLLFPAWRQGCAGCFGACRDLWPRRPNYRCFSPRNGE